MRTLSPICVAALLAAASFAQDDRKISAAIDKSVIRVTGLPDPKSPTDQLARVQVKAATADETDQRPPLAGRWLACGNDLIFEPRFPLSPGITYRVAVDPTGGGKPQYFDLALPAPDLTPVTKLTQIYPTRTVLPENQLRFYLQFSGPMSRGEAYRHITLLDEQGKPIPDMFLALEEELWDPTMTRFTLLFDPGRVKNGLKPREEAGPTLEQGKKYTLVVNGDWRDGEGRKLTQKKFRKSFAAGPPDNEAIDPKKWKLSPPMVGTAEPLRIRFGEPLDYGLLKRVVWVTDANGRKVDGTVELEDEETCWNFTPAKPWAAGSYKLVADAILEDLAANRVGRLFEVDVFKPVTKSIETKIVEIPFTVGKPEGGR